MEPMYTISIVSFIWMKVLTLSQWLSLVNLFVAPFFILIIIGVVYHLGVFVATEKTNHHGRAYDCSKGFKHPSNSIYNTVVSYIVLPGLPRLFHSPDTDIVHENVRYPFPLLNSSSWHFAHSVVALLGLILQQSSTRWTVHLGPFIRACTDYSRGHSRVHASSIPDNRLSTLFPTHNLGHADLRCCHKGVQPGSILSWTD